MAAAGKGREELLKRERERSNGKGVDIDRKDYIM